jgi:hypothetical protein
MSEKELKPCPFCGFEPIINDSGFYKQIECSNLHCLMHPKTNFMLSEYREAWNTRTNQGLVPLDEKLVTELLDDLHYDAPYLAKLICAKFGTTTPRHVSADDIFNFLMDFTKTPEGDHKGFIIGQEFEDFAQAIASHINGGV